MSTDITSETGLLARIASSERPIIALKTIVIVAHPGDETLACGALLPRLRDVRVLHVTDGAPRDSVDARRSGFTHWADYARARRAEVERATALAGLSSASLKSLGIPDRAAALKLSQLTRALLGFIAGADLVLTHGYEGKHPDHDAVAFAVWAARAQMRGRAPVVMEMPLSLQIENEARGQNAFDASVRLHLNEQERALKAKMLNAFETQRRSFTTFDLADEYYRVAPEHAFGQPIDSGVYDDERAGVTGGQFAELARAARSELGLNGLARQA